MVIRHDLFFLVKPKCLGKICFQDSLTVGQIMDDYYKEDT